MRHAGLLFSFSVCGLLSPHFSELVTVFVRKRYKAVARESAAMYHNPLVSKSSTDMISSSIGMNIDDVCANIVSTIVVVVVVHDASGGVSRRMYAFVLSCGGGLSFLYISWLVVLLVWVVIFFFLFLSLGSFQRFQKDLTYLFSYIFFG